MRRGGGTGNVCHLVLQLGGRLDPNRLDAVVANADWLHWLGRLRLDTGGWWGLPHWREDTSAPDVVVQRHDVVRFEDAEAVVLAESVDVRTTSPIALQHIRSGRGDAVALTFHHAALDAHGAELLLRRLAGDMDAPTTEQLLPVVAPEERSWWARLLSAKRARDFVLRQSIGPLRYPSPRRLPHGAGLHYHRFVLTPDETKQVGLVARTQGAALGAAAFHLAAVARAMRHAVGHRLKQHGDFLIPMPADRRRRGADGPIFGNQISLLFYRVPVDGLDDLPAIVRSVLEQMRDTVRAKLPAAFDTLLGLCRRLPAGFLSAVVQLPTLGRMASFGFSDTGPTLANLDDFLGSPIQDALHYPGNLHPPGITIVCSRHDNRLAFCIAWLSGTLSDEEVTRFEEHLRHTLLTPGQPAPTPPTP
jgi:hypothetical protein